MSWQTRVVVSAFVGVAVGAVGPRVFGARDRPGGEFQYFPPSGFVESAQATATLGRTAVGGQRAWIASEGATTHDGYTPNVTVTHAPDVAPDDTRDVAVLAEKMKRVFASSGLEWTETREIVHVRTDGARVGVIEWAHPEDARGAPYRMMQMAFPDGSGSSIVTALFPAAEGTRWEKDFEATVETAEGVAFRAPPPPAWAYAAWGAGAAGVTWVVLMALGMRGRPTPAGVS